MESVYGNSYESRDPGDYSYPSSPFNPIRGESRSSFVDTSESRTASESSSAPVAPIYSGSNRPQSFQTTVSGVNSNTPKYNSSQEIDELIDNLLKKNLPDLQTVEGKAVLSERAQKIEELKKLADEIRKEEKERKEIEEIKQENEWLDRILASMRKQDPNYGKRL